MKTMILVWISFFVLAVPFEANANEPSIDDVKAAWLETASKTKSCRFHWTETRHVGKDFPASYTYSLFLQEASRLRLKRSTMQFNTERKRNITETYTTTYNGQVGSSFYGRDFVDRKTFPVGFVSFGHSDWDNYHVLPILFAVRPINAQFSPFSDREYRIAGEVNDVDGRELLELRPKNVEGEEPTVQYIYFVDSERSFSITRVVMERSGRRVWQLDLSNRLDEKSGCWVPGSWHLRDEFNQLNFVVQHVEVDLDAKFVDEQFSFEFPTHALVTDRTFTNPLVYILRKDGRKRIITSEERRGGIHYTDYLASLELEASGSRD